ETNHGHCQEIRCEEAGCQEGRQEDHCQEDRRQEAGRQEGCREEDRPQAGGEEGRRQEEAGGCEEDHREEGRQEAGGEESRCQEACRRQGGEGRQDQQDQQDRQEVSTTTTGIIDLSPRGAQRGEIDSETSSRPCRDVSFIGVRPWMAARLILAIREDRKGFRSAAMDGRPLDSRDQGGSQGSRSAAMAAARSTPATRGSCKDRCHKLSSRSMPPRQHDPGHATAECITACDESPCDLPTRRNAVTFPTSAPRRSQGTRRSWMHRGKKRGYLSTLGERPWIPDIHTSRAAACAGPSGPLPSPSLPSSPRLPPRHGC